MIEQLKGQDDRHGIQEARQFIHQTTHEQQRRLDYYKFRNYTDTQVFFKENI